MKSVPGKLPGFPVAEGVGRIGGFVNIYTYQDDGALYLIDAGFGRGARAITRAFRDADAQLEGVREILLTHHHLDHSGGAAYIHERFKVPVACHVEDAPFVDGRDTLPISRWMRLFAGSRPVPVATTLKDGDRIGSLQVIHAPGHTPGSAVYYDPARKLLFSGDVVVERKGKLALAPTRYAASVNQAVQSLARLRGLAVEVLLPGHGVPVRNGYAAMLDDLIRRAPGEYLSDASH